MPNFVLSNSVLSNSVLSNSVLSNLLPHPALITITKDLKSHLTKRFFDSILSKHLVGKILFGKKKKNSQEKKK